MAKILGQAGDYIYIDKVYISVYKGFIEAVDAVDNGG